MKKNKSLDIHTARLATRQATIENFVVENITEL